MNGAGPSRILAAVILGSYTLAAVAVVLWSLLFSDQSPAGLLGSALQRPLIAAALFAPLVIGLVVQWAGRRLWAWPYVYLVVFCLALGTRAADIGDAVYLHSSAAVWVLTVLVAEAVGLALGRWLHRFVGIAYFLGAGAWLLIAAFGQTGHGTVGRWQIWTLGLAGALFLLHAAFQLLNHLRGRPVAAGPPAETDGAGEDQQRADAGPPDPEAAGWTFHPLGRLMDRADSERGKVDNDANDSRPERP